MYVHYMNTAMVYYFASSDCVNSRSVASVSPRSTFQRGTHHTVKKGIHVHCTYINLYILSIYMYMYMYIVHTLISTYCRYTCTCTMYVQVIEIHIQFMCILSIMCVAHKRIGKSSQTVTVL